MNYLSKMKTFSKQGNRQSVTKNTEMTVSVACDIFVFYYLSKMEEVKFDTLKCAVQKSSITLCQSLMLR